MERFAAVAAPRMLGAPPGDGGATGRAVVEFFGLAPVAVPEDGSAAAGGTTPVIAGLPGAAGVARGVARVLRGLGEADRLAAGEVLVTATTLPAWTPVMTRAAAVVTDTGGALCHAAVVARELGVPAVVGTTRATGAIADGQQVEVDGSRGLVRLL